MSPHNTSSGQASAATSGYQFNAWKGVFIPSILTILGVIMYLRFGWVLGNVGLGNTLLIVVMATSITFLTALSMSALATNMPIGGGGAYYIISRSLGPEAGAAVGLPLFLAQALGISFYITGFSESITALFPFLPQVEIGILTLLVLVWLAYRSADIALRMQLFIFGLIVASLISFFLNGSPVPVSEVTVSSLIPRVGFWVVFAVFFPAVTGIEAGLAMSGDLKEPSKALPLGTLSAIGVSFLVYMSIPIFLFYKVPDERALIENPLIMRDVAKWGQLILCGLWGASLSSAVGALLGAPRTLQALARDHVIPRFIGKGFGPGNDPQIATGVAFAVALCGLMTGNLNSIATVLTMFFLTSYGLLNLCAALEGLIASPSWRPTFKTPWQASALGAVGCLIVMFMINSGATIIATIVCSGIYWHTKRRHLRTYWGDIRYGILMLSVWFSLQRMAEREPDERTWRPNILVLSGSPTSRWYLIELAHAIALDKGFLTVATILPREPLAVGRIKSLETSIKEYLAKRRVKALVKVIVEDDPLSGVESLVAAYGFGPLTPNTILMGETEKPEHFIPYTRVIQRIHRMQRNLIIVREADDPTRPRIGSRVDVWWGAKREGADLMLALGYLLTESHAWRDVQLHLKAIVETPEEQVEALSDLSTFLQSARLEVQLDVLVGSKENIWNIIREASADASLVFLGMRPPEEEETTEAYCEYYKTLISQTEDFPPTAFVLASQDISFERMFDANAPTWRSHVREAPKK